MHSLTCEVTDRNRMAGFIPACIGIYIHDNVWGEITYPFLNFNGATVEV